MGLDELTLLLAAANASDGGNTRGFSSNLSNCRRGRSPRESGSLVILFLPMAKTLSAFNLPMSSGNILIRLRLRSKISRASSFNICEARRQRPDLGRRISFGRSD